MIAPNKRIVARLLMSFLLALGILIASRLTGAVLELLHAKGSSGAGFLQLMIFYVDGYGIWLPVIVAILMGLEVARREKVVRDNSQSLITELKTLMSHGPVLWLGRLIGVLAIAYVVVAAISRA